MRLSTTPFVTGGGFQKVTAQFFYAKSSFDAWYRVRVGSEPPYVRELGRILPGGQRQTLWITDTNALLAPGETTTLTVEIFDNEACGGAPRLTYTDNAWGRTRHWQFYYCQTMHTDIGYTDPQEELPELYASYLDTVEEYLQKSDRGIYGEQPYKYEVESAWMLQDGFMKTRSAEKTQGLVDRIRKGDVDVAAGRFNYTMECFDTEEAARAAYFTNRYLVDKLGIRPANTIRMFDNPAFSKSFVDVAASAGIKYGLHSMNPDRSPYHKVRQYDLFYMQGFQKENKLLVFNGKTYGDNYGFGGSYGDSKLGSVERAEKDLLTLMKTLESRTGRRAYPYDKFPLALIPFGDNKPPLEDQIQIVNQLNHKWKNEGYAYPHIISAFPQQFFEDVEAEYRDLIPVETGTEENWWNDGWGTAAYESGVNKQAGALIPVAETLAGLSTTAAGSCYPYDALYEASQRNIVYDEHTFGYHSYSDDENYYGQSAWKRSNAFGAMTLAKSCADEAAGALAARLGNAGLTVTVFNLFPRGRTDVVSVAVDDRLPAQFELYDGAEKLNYTLADNKLRFIARGVPAFGYKNFTVKAGGKSADRAPACACGDDFIENRYYKVTFRADGSIASIIDKENGNRELVDAKADEGFNQYRYYDDFGVPFSNMGAPFTRDRYSVYVPKAADTKMKASLTPLGVSMQVCTKTFRASDIRQTVTLYPDIKRIDIRNEVIKCSVPHLKAKEEAFYTFPFRARNHQIRYGLPIGSVAEGEQVYGTSTDWYSVNKWMSVSDPQEDYHMLLAVPNAILAQFGERRTGKWSFDYRSQKPYIYSYVFNNMWQTNFQGDQPGMTVFEYSIFSGKGKEVLENASFFGDECAAAMPAALSDQGKNSAADGTFLTVSAPNVAVTSLKAAQANGDGMILRFCEKCGKPADAVEVRLPEWVVSYCETDVIENDIGESVSGNTLHFSIPAYGIKTFRLLSGRLLEQVAGVRAVSDARRTVITWQPVDGAAYYEVFRAGAQDDQKRWISSTVHTTLCDVQVTSADSADYRYYVRACADGVKGMFSDAAAPVTGAAHFAIAEAPVVEAFERNDQRIDLSWTPDCVNAVHHYEIYRNDIKIGETRDGYVCAYRDKTAEFPRIYTYRVAAVDFDGNTVSSAPLIVNRTDMRFAAPADPVVLEAKKHPMRPIYRRIFKK